MAAPVHITSLQRSLEIGIDGNRRLMSVPGCWDGLSALLIEQSGFPAAFLSGGALSMARIGRADIGLTTITELLDAVSAIRDRVNLPVIVDGDTGFGNTLNVQRSVRMLERAGASAIQIEDQTFPKRCGHLAGKSVVPLDQATGRIRAALDAREHALIIARTDALAVEGFASALARAEGFLAAGADLVFVEGPRDIAQLTRIGRELGSRVPLVHNLVEGSGSPVETGDGLEALGFAVALHPLVLLHGFARMAPDLLQGLKQARSTVPLADRLLTLDQINEVVGLRADLGKAEQHGG
jgi:2-methylisocitrate lyase-like PEP mutase family enzyme